MEIPHSNVFLPPTGDNLSVSVDRGCGGLEQQPVPGQSGHD